MHSKYVFIAFGIRKCFQTSLEICTVSTYNDVVRYVIYADHKYDIYMVVRVERFPKVEYFAWI